MPILVLLLLPAIVAAALVVSPVLRERAKGYRTVLLAVATAALGALEQADLAEIVPAGDVGLWMIGIAVAFAVLRALTTTPLGRGE